VIIINLTLRTYSKIISVHSFVCFLERLLEDRISYSKYKSRDKVRNLILTKIKLNDTLIVNSYILHYIINMFNL